MGRATSILRSHFPDRFAHHGFRLHTDPGSYSWITADTVRENRGRLGDEHEERPPTRDDSARLPWQRGRRKNDEDRPSRNESERANKGAPIGRGIVFLERPGTGSPLPLARTDRSIPIGRTTRVRARKRKISRDLPTNR